MPPKNSTDGHLALSVLGLCEAEHYHWRPAGLMLVRKCRARKGLGNQANFQSPVSTTLPPPTRLFFPQISITYSQHKQTNKQKAMNTQSHPLNTGSHFRPQPQYTRIPFPHPSMLVSNTQKTTDSEGPVHLLYLLSPREWSV
jgi:hypothetical protein